MQRAWVAQAVELIESDFQRSADTHMIKVDLPWCASVHLYLKDESTHPTGSLKHRLARSLFLYGLCNGWITEGKPLVEASSGSTAVSEAYFARLIGVPFTAVMPRSTSRAKIEQIAHYGGDCHFVNDAGAVYAEAERLTKSLGGHYLDQFTYAERATDWRGNNNIAESIFCQLQRERHPIPAWIVVGAGTGGTSATIGRYLRYTGVPTQLCVVDPENSVFADHFYGRPVDSCIGCSSGIEGIGRPRVEPSFVPEVIERMIQVPNAASLAAMRYLERLLGRRYGGSTGTNVFGALQLIAEMEAAGESGSVVTLACDPGDRYLDTYYDDDWVAAQGYDLSQHSFREQPAT